MHRKQAATMDDLHRRTLRGYACLSFALVALALIFHSTVGAQSSSASGPQTTPFAGTQQIPPKKLDNKDIAERPYNAIFTKPQYASTPAQQKQFTVQYVYNYAESTYTPSVPLPLVARSTFKFNTPENALIALYSVMRSGDFDGFLSCWDDSSRTVFEAQAKSSPQFKQQLLSNWKTVVVGKAIVLTHRLDTVNYVILDAVIQNAYGPGKSFDDSEVLVFEKGRWVLSNQFQTDGLIVQHDFKTAGNVKSYDFDLRPLVPGAAGAAANHAQEQFLKAHNKTAVVTQTVE